MPRRVFFAIQLEAAWQIATLADALGAINNPDDGHMPPAAVLEAWEAGTRVAPGPGARDLLEAARAELRVRQAEWLAERDRANSVEDGENSDGDGEDVA